MDQETSFWRTYEAQNTSFQEANLLNIVTHYVTTSYDKTACHTSSVGGEAYIQELINTSLS